MGGRLNLDGGKLNLDGGTRSPYNLSVDQWYTHSTNHPQCTVQSIVTERKIDYRQMPPEKSQEFDRSVALLAGPTRGGFRGVHRTRAKGGPDSGGPEEFRCPR